MPLVPGRHPEISIHTRTHHLLQRWLAMTLLHAMELRNALPEQSEGDRSQFSLALNYRKVAVYSFHNPGVFGEKLASPSCSNRNSRLNGARQKRLNQKS